MNIKNLPAVIILLSIILAIGLLVFLGKNINPEKTPDIQNVSLLSDGTQIINIGARGGYYPKITNAKANLPTILKLKTTNTFDCSSAVVIPSLGYRANLPPSGETEIKIPPQQDGSVLRGACAMGMYSFEIRFE